jgi:hypothetical protein
VFRNDVRFGTSTVSFCVPSLRSYLPAGTALMTMPINTRVVMEGAVTLRTGSVVPSSVALLNGAGVATGNFIGVFSSIQAVRHAKPPLFLSCLLMCFRFVRLVCR